MFQQNDYMVYFKQLYAIEVEMEHEATYLLRVIKDPVSQKILKHILADEKRHELLVKRMMELTKP